MLLEFDGYPGLLVGNCPFTPDIFCSILSPQVQEDGSIPWIALQRADGGFFPELLLDVDMIVTAINQELADNVRITWGLDEGCLAKRYAEPYWYGFRTGRAATLNGCLENCPGSNMGYADNLSAPTAS